MVCWGSLQTAAAKITVTAAVIDILYKTIGYEVFIKIN